MTDWIDDLADALSDRLGGARGALRLGGEEAQDILEAARALSHRTERSNASLASYLVGRYVSARVAAGVDPDRALAEALNVVKRMLAHPPSL